METSSRAILWFRHGLRLHDNPALCEALKSDDGKPVLFYPIFIFDGESAGTKQIGYNRMKFLLESLEDLDKQFKEKGGRLLLFQGNPVDIFRRLREILGINKICYEQDCEPIWAARDKSVERLCDELSIERHEKISHTLWDPHEIIKTNGGFPPLTYQMFLHTVNVLKDPSRPIDIPSFDNTIFGEIPDLILSEFNAFTEIPSPEDFNIYPECLNIKPKLKWKGGETRALLQLERRLKVEEDAFKQGAYLPNQANLDILGPPTSMSAALKYGCLSIRTFFYKIHDLFETVQHQNALKFSKGHHITGQLIWREYFYTMSVKNINYGQMKDNPICLDITWAPPNETVIQKWKEGMTGFPLIDAAMRQLLAEGWIHHVLRNIIATFLTRGGLWLSWEIGLQHFLKYLLDADWSVCAGNWMWISSSAFEKLLDSSKCTCPIAFAKRLDPKGTYIKRYVPELKKFPTAYIHHPWKAPLQVQETAECIIGEQYPEPMIDLNLASQRNTNAMNKIRESLMGTSCPEHVRPSDENEIRNFFWLYEDTSIKVQ